MSHRLSVIVFCFSTSPALSSSFGRYTLNIVKASPRSARAFNEAGIGVPNDIAHQITHTNNVVRRHRGERTIETRSNQLSSGPRKNRGTHVHFRDSPRYEDLLASIEDRVVAVRRLGGLGRAGGTSSSSNCGGEWERIGNDPEGVERSLGGVLVAEE
jgi:hypothetical protein